MKCESKWVKGVGVGTMVNIQVNKYGIGNVVRERCNGKRRGRWDTRGNREIITLPPC